MIKVGLREANMHFSKYVKMVRQGQEVVVTERGTAIAVIKPLGPATSPEKRIAMLEEQGVLRRAARKKIVPVKAIRIEGKPISETLAEERSER
ncbi:MAG: type II toxin-antitoxin system prevent-host-death family antitoxin [Nitrospirota bacterium]|nr:type II toxin-antitoxin system prevent-host-death family antitoxin [Nitrospirota bacterium]